MFSKRFLKEDTLPVTTGEGERFRKLNLFPVPVRPLKPMLISEVGSVVLRLVPGIDSCRFLSLRSGEGLGLLVFEKGVVQRGLGPVRVTGIRDSAVRCSKRSLVLLTEPWLARAKIRRGLGLLALLGGSVWGQMARSRNFGASATSSGLSKLLTGRSAAVSTSRIFHNHRHHHTIKIINLHCRNF